MHCKFVSSAYWALSIIREKFHHFKRKQFFHVVLRSSVYNASHTLPTEYFRGRTRGDLLSF